jgi:hypothetical protein
MGFSTWRLIDEEFVDRHASVMVFVMEETA